ncbi:MFS transporter [Vibrio sp. SCSIO 43140]|uniref:MFS transporter n=1 Tax=Vibrio sp. SCSIO 43140 TaxID=2819100 RepID=UPI002075E998|nr:MFS transporter [Vibrio sp. SCSIO 43140]
MLNKLGIELWFSSHLAYGFVQLVFIPVILPAFVAERTGSLANAGIAMGFFGIAGLLAPVIGWLADRFKSHRYVQVMGMGGYVLAGACFIFAGHDLPLMLAGSALFGIGSATLLMLNPVFITFAGLDSKTEAIKLGRLIQVSIIGTLLGGGLIAMLMDAQVGYEVCFGVMMVIISVLALITLVSNKQAAQRVLDYALQQSELQQSAQPQEVKQQEPQQRVNSEETGSSILSILRSRFGLFLFAVGALCAGQGIFQAQYPNLVGEAFLVPQSIAAATLSISAVLGLVVVLFAERYSSVKGPIALFRVCTIVSVLVALCLVMIIKSPSEVFYLIPVALVVTYLQGITLTDMSSPAVACRLSTCGGGYTQGLMMFFISIGFAFGSGISGFIAESLGWAAVPFAIMVLTALAMVIILVLSAEKARERTSTMTNY